MASELYGGIPVGSTILISGGSGVGKTTLSMQFLANGVKFGVKVKYLIIGFLLYPQSIFYMLMQALLLCFYLLIQNILEIPALFQMVS